MPFWKTLPPHLQTQAERWLPRYHAELETLRYLTYSEWGPDGQQAMLEVIDPVWVSRTPRSWQHFVMLTEGNDYEHFMMSQAVATRDLWRWQIPPGAHAGAKVHVLGNGPSAASFPGPEPGDIVIAINGARALVDRPDYWILADSGFIGGPSWVASMAELARQDPSVVTIMSPGSSPELADILYETHWFLTPNAPGPGSTRFYRHIAPEGAQLPSFISARQTIVSTMHFGWWLLQGAGEIHLWGADFGCDKPPASLADYYAGAHAPGGAELHITEEWFHLSGDQGPGWTTPELLSVSRGVDAMSAFILDDGVRIYQHRLPGTGVRLVFPEVVEEGVLEEAAA